MGDMDIICRETGRSMHYFSGIKGAQTPLGEPHYMNMFARSDENPAMTLQDIKETKRYRRTDARTDNMKTVYTPQSLRGV